MISRVLIVGLGSIGKRHLRLARSILPKADIRVLRHKFTDEGVEYANGCVFDLESALAFEPQIAVISNPAPFHVPTAQALASEGVHLLIEKPLSNSLNGVSRLIETCLKRRTTLLMGYNLRYLPSLQRFRELIQASHVGKILSVRCEIGNYLPSWRPDRDYRQCVTANKELGGGALLELSHEIDYLRWIFGEVEWILSSLSKQSRLEINVEDAAHLILGFKPQEDNSQIIGTLHIDLFRHDHTRKCVAIGEKGSLCWNGLTGQVMEYRAGGNEWLEVFRYQHQRDESYHSEWRHFLNCIAENVVPAIGVEDGLRVLEIIEAAHRSSASDRKVSISKDTDRNNVIK